MWICGRLDSRWLKEIFGESSEGSEGSRQETRTLCEKDEGGIIVVASRVGESTETSK